MTLECIKPDDIGRLQKRNPGVVATGSKFGIRIGQEEPEGHTRQARVGHSAVILLRRDRCLAISAVALLLRCPGLSRVSLRSTITSE